jgi:hypothetical protein
MATTQKAIALARSLQQNLAQRFADVAVSSSFGTDSDPLITVAGIAIVRVKPEASIGKDVLGLPQTVFTPHIIQVLIDANATTIPTYGVWALKLFGEACQTGAKVEFYSSNTLAEGQIVSGNLQSTFDSIQYPLMATV